MFEASLPSKLNKYEENNLINNGSKRIFRIDEIEC